MAGTGRLSLPLAAAGVDLTAVELVPAMAARLAAKRRGADLGGGRLALLCGDVCRLPFRGRFPLALLPFQGFTELATVDDQRRALAAIAAALVPGGRLLLTLHDPELRRAAANPTWSEVVRRPVEPGAAPGRPGARELTLELRLTAEDAGRRMAGGQRIRLLDGGGALLEERTVALAFSLIERDDFATRAEAAGFAVRSLNGGFGGEEYHPGESPFMLWTLERRR